MDRGTDAQRGMVQNDVHFVASGLAESKSRMSPRAGESFCQARFNPPGL